MTLSGRDLAILADHFRSAHDRIERAPKDLLVEAVVDDLSTAAQTVLAKPIHFGLSRWSALQATEKFYKAYIATKAPSFEYIHDLEKLDGAARTLGLQGLPNCVLDIIRCQAAVRYDGSTSTLIRAVEAAKRAFLHAVY